MKIASRLAVLAFATFSYLAYAQTQWTSIGPKGIGAAPNLYAGPVNTLLVDPRNASTVYAGTGGGGVWKTTDGGTNWLPLTDSVPANLHISVLALDPGNPNTIYAGTGRLDTRLGSGMLKSTDGGATWTLIASPWVTGGFSDAIQAISVHPTNGQIVLASRFSVIYRSTDGGTSWAKTFDALGSIRKIVFDPANPNHAYATVDSTGIIQTQDAGLTWTVSNGAGSTSFPANTHEINLVMAPSSRTILYAKGTSNDTGRPVFYRSTDGGLNWTQITSPDPALPITDIWDLSVAPTNPNILYAANHDVYRSSDSGQSWTRIYTDSNPLVLQHALATSSDGTRLYLGNDAGVYSTSTPTAASPSWTNLNATFVTAQIRHGFALHPTDINTALVGTDIHGTLRYQGSPTWQISDPGNTGAALIDPTNPSNAFHTNGGEVRKSSTGGAPGSWQSVFENFTSDPALTFDSSNPPNIYYGSTYLVYQAAPGGNLWTALANQPYPEHANYYAPVFAPAPSDPNTLYIGYNVNSPTCSSYVYVTRDALSGSHLTYAGAAQPTASSCITQIVVDPQDPKTAYATFSQSTYPDVSAPATVYRTNDSGASWTNITANLPALPINDLLIDPDLPGIYYVATNRGVYRTVDSGLSWVRFGTGLPNAKVTGIQLHRPSRTLRASTFGRGMWDLSVPKTAQVRVTISASLTGAPFTLEDGVTYQTPVTFAWEAGSNHTVTFLTAGTGVRYKFQSWADGNASNPRSLTTPSTNSTYTANLTARYQLTTNVTPAGSSTISVNPSSTDGYYEPGTTVQISSNTAPGYSLVTYSGDVGIVTNPLSITMNGPRSITAISVCFAGGNLVFYTPFGPGPTGAATFEWLTGAGCSWTITSDSPWLTFTGPTSGTGSAIVPFSIAQNAGAQRTAKIAVSGDLALAGQVTQEGPPSQKPSVMSFKPTSGVGLSQVFTAQLYHPAGYQNIDLVNFQLGSGGCYITYFKISTQWYVEFRDFSPGSTTPPINASLPFSGALSNSYCSLSSVAVPVFGVGNTLVVNLALTFTDRLLGDQAIYVTARDAASGITSPFVVISHYTVGTPGCTYTISPPDASFGSSGGQGTVTVATPPLGCPWKATSSDSFVSFPNGSSGTGSGPLVYNLAPNLTQTPRYGTIVIANQRVMINQDAFVPPSLAATVSHHGNFAFGQQNATYTISVTNATGAAPTSGLVTVTEQTPINGLTLVSMSGDGWLCGANTCARGDALVGGTRYPPITVTFNVAANAPSQVTNGLVISGGGSATTQASDPTNIATTPTSAPSVTSISPITGSGATQTYTFQFSNSAGYTNLNIANVLINTALDGRHGCYIAYSLPANTVYLVNDAGDAGGPYAGTLLLNGSSTAIGNSQCTITAAGSYAVGSGNTLTLTLNMTFSTTAFAGNRVIFLAARDAAQNNTGWQTMGVRTVPGSTSTFPTPIGMNPASGTTSNTTLTFTYADATSANNLQTAWALINTALDGRASCYVAYYRPGNQIYLYPDNGDGSQATSMVLTGTNTLSNSQCTISSQGSSVTSSGSQLLVNLNLTFKSAFTGPKGAWLAVQTVSGATSPWQAWGAWQVP